MEAQRIGVIGAGAWGTAVAKILAEKGHTVELWVYEQEVVDTVNTSHRNNLYLMGVELPEGITATNSLSQAVAHKDYLLLALPSLYLLPAVKQITKMDAILEGSVPIGILTKGFVSLNGRPLLITTALERYLPGSYTGNLVYISGPSHAEEVARGKLTGLISASRNPRQSIAFRQLLSGRNVVVYSSLDVNGVQAAAALKNIIAIAFGILDALKDFSGNVGDNTESLLLAAGLSEIHTIGTALGSTHPETFASIAGVGDLDVTCRSVYGRNRRVGREIIHDRVLSRFNDIEDLLAGIAALGYLPEGTFACRHAYEIAREHGLRVPIITTVYRILNREVDPAEALNASLLHMEADREEEGQ
jgi:glycerol-3-phosphate dehydrogenase (NAD(P)+)